MRILFIHGNSDNVAGQELSLLARLKGLTALGMYCEVLLPSDGSFSCLLKENGFKVRIAPLNRGTKKSVLPYLKTVWAIYRLLGKNKIDVVHCSGVYPTQYSLPAARLRGIPCVAHVSTNCYTEYDFRSSFIKYVDKVICVSKACEVSVLNRGSILSDKVVTVYNGIFEGDISISEERLSCLRKKYSIAENENIVGQMSQIRPEKGLEEFVMMARIVKDMKPDTRFMIVGDVMDKERDKAHYEYLKRIIAENGLQEDIIFTGFQQNPYEYLALFDISVLCSYIEGLPRTIIESMLMNRPVVSTDVGGISEVVIAGETGVLFPKKDYKRMAESVAGLLEDKTKADRLAENAKKLVQDKFLIKTQALKVKRIYEDILGKSPKKKILFYEDSSGFGGSAVALANIIKFIDRDKYAPVLAVTGKSELFKDVPEQSIIKIKKYGIISTFLRLYREIRRRGIDIVHINTNIIGGIPAIIAAKAAGVPCVCHIRGNRKLIKRELFFTKWVNKFVVLNKQAEDMYKQDIPVSKLALIHDGIDTEKFRRFDKGVLRARLGLNSDPVVGLVGRIVKGKGHKEFVLCAKEVLAEMPDVKFVVVGEPRGEDDSYYGQVRELVRREGLDKAVLFAGWVDDISSVFADIDINIQASTMPEGFGMTSVESMVLGKPVVATKIGGSLETVVDGETGFLVAPGDFRQMAEKIMYLFKEPAFAKAMGEKGRVRALECFNASDKVDEIEGLYEELL